MFGDEASAMASLSDSEFNRHMQTPEAERRHREQRKEMERMQVKEQEKKKRQQELEERLNREKEEQARREAELRAEIEKAERKNDIGRKDWKKSAIESFLMRSCLRSI